MNRGSSFRPLLLAGAMMLGPVPLTALQAPSLDADRWNRAALEWVGLLRDGDFEAAAARVDPAVPADSFSADALGRLWGQIGGQVGDLVSLEPGVVTEEGEYHVVDMPGRFENQALTVRVVLTDSLLVSGFFLRPPDPPAYDPPAYVETSAFEEVELVVGDDPWTLPAVLSVPQGDGPFPGLVLVHGSGPNDMDETIGGNRPFRDLAWGLASAGIAVLRYDKRTRAHAASLPAEIGLDEEVVDDAVAALQTLRARAPIDAGRTFVLGHSLGGLMAPGIAQRDGAVAGVIVLAGPARPFATVLVEQLEYLRSLDADPASRQSLDSLIAMAHRVGTGDLGATDTLLGVPASYWRELQAVDPVTTARGLEVPMLILQGGRDYQVTEADLEAWRSGLGDRPDVDLKLYPGLNHLFAPGEGTATPAEYTGDARHVDPAVVADIAAWIREVRGTAP